MFAIRFTRFGPPEVLSVGSSPEPHAGPGQVRVRVRAAGVSPVDVLVRSGRSSFGERIVLPHVPGVDAAGVVDEVGADVSGVAVGDEVFGAVDVALLGGASAEFAVLAFWAARPGSLSWEEAGGAGTGVETATRALDLLDVRDGATLLIDGAAGGVGSLVVPLAIARGARVVGTGSPENHDFIAGLGAVPAAYGEHVRGVDLVLDVAGRGSLPDLVSLTGSAASVVTLSDFTGPTSGVRLSTGALGGEPDGRHGLAVAATLAEEGRFHVPLREVFPLARADRAHALVEHGPRRGKVVLTVPG
ncbi:NADP-dependent oxidoreductase [Umezawaea endophytica]|uniref:NADP-dependent oxidoreductase n=1 Tax=Umezawaea endophytica TaxID=1654476 RepID=A0A9X2VML1_9PSEU|nr:NADP-dependent oxidoreductase [Umezawaea endophytica]MCS7479380.1 NADP-dependent oxidoreductase [Umezawaea endophytica]